jgi:galactokinase
MESLKKQFFNNFGKDNKTKIIRSPLRICPLGAHVDHQHGVVTGMTLEASINMVYSCNHDGLVKVQSLDFPDEDYFHVDDVPGLLPGFWGNYLRGAILSLKRHFRITKGINAVISGKHPIGGLSSSAAVTTAYLLALCDVNGINVTKTELIKYNHWVETDFIKLNNGILDQSANILGEDNHLMFMDCKTGKYEMIEKPAQMNDFEIVVVFSGLYKTLISTDYNNRVDECKVAAWILQEYNNEKRKVLKDTKLRDISPETYYTYKDLIPGKFAKRAEHFFTENQRVLEGVQAWRKGDIQHFGKLMFDSGESSIVNYESGCPELITIYNILKETPGVYGARFSGAGYRGCCIGLIDPKYKIQIKQNVDNQYPVKHPEYKDSYQVYFSKTDGGARIL